MHKFLAQDALKAFAIFTAKDSAASITLNGSCLAIRSLGFHFPKQEIINNFNELLVTKGLDAFQFLKLVDKLVGPNYEKVIAPFEVFDEKLTRNIPHGDFQYILELVSLGDNPMKKKLGNTSLVDYHLFVRRSYHNLEPVEPVSDEINDFEVKAGCPHFENYPLIDQSQKDRLKVCFQAENAGKTIAKGNF